MRIPFEIETRDMRVAFDLAGRDGKLTSGTVVDAPGGARIEFGGSIERQALDIPSVLQFVVDATVTVDLSLFATWLYDKVKNRGNVKIRVRRREITVITPEGIRKVLEEELKVR